MKMFGIHKCRKDDRGNWQRYVDKDYLWINFDLVKSVQIEYESTNVYPTYEDQYFKLVLEFNDNDKKTLIIHNDDKNQIEELLGN